MDNIEIWKPIKGFEGKYEVSDLGNVRSVRRKFICKSGRHYSVRGKLIYQHLGTSGYKCVSLYNEDGKIASFKIHRLVAEAFVDKAEGKMYVDHINADRQDNRATNLRWVTLKENSNNPLAILHAKTPIKKNERLITVKPHYIPETAPNFPRKLYKYTLDGVFVCEYMSMLHAERSTGIESNGIRKALNKSYKTAGGYLWKTEKSLLCEPYKRRRHTKCRTIEMIDSNGNIVKSWNAMRDAASELSTTHTRIFNHIANKKPLDGYWFRYSDTKIV